MAGGVTGDMSSDKKCLVDKPVKNATKYRATMYRDSKNYILLAYGDWNGITTETIAIDQEDIDSITVSNQSGERMS